MLPDVLSKGLALVVCGTAASAASAAQARYYAGPGNKFWHTLHEIRLTNRLLAPSECLELLGEGVGLTDLVKDQSGSDSAIAFSEAARSALQAKIVKFAPAYVCFNGKRAAQQYFGIRSAVYGLQDARLGRTEFFVAPSTSGAARRYWDVDMWRDLAARVRRARGAA